MGKDDSHIILREHLITMYALLPNKVKPEFSVEQNIIIMYNEAIECYLNYQLLHYSNDYKEYDKLNITIIKEVKSALMARNLEKDYEHLDVLNKMIKYIKGKPARIWDMD